MDFLHLPSQPFQSTRLYKPRRVLMRAEEEGILFQSTRLYKPRRAARMFLDIVHKFQSTRLYKPRPNNSFNAGTLRNFNPRGRKDLDVLPMHLGSFPLYFNPRGRKDLDSQRIKNYKNSNISIHEVAKTSTANPSKNPIPSPAKSISIIQPPHDYFHQIIISTLYFIHFSPKTGANPPANPWELTVRTN